MSDDAMNEKVKAGYNKAATAYSSGFRDQFKSEKYLDQFLAYLPTNATVLDIGCGGGKPIDTYLVAHGMNVIGIDISDAQIALAKQNVPEARYEVQDMSELAEHDFAVDAIVSFYAIFHTPREQHGKLLKVWRSFLKSGGLLLLTMGAEEWEGKEDNFCGTDMYWSHYGAEKNLQLIQQAGFETLFSEIDDAGGEKHLVILAKAI